MPPPNFSAVRSRLVETAIPLPSQLFSLTENAILPPLVPMPAPALISPVGFSSTNNSIIF